MQYFIVHNKNTARIQIRAEAKLLPHMTVLEGPFAGQKNRRGEWYVPDGVRNRCLILQGREPRYITLAVSAKPTKTKRMLATFTTDAI